MTDNKQTKHIVLVSNRKKMALELNKSFKGRVGLLLSIGASYRRNPGNLPFALDNGRFPVWFKKIKWNKTEYLKLLDWTYHLRHKPLFAVVPDVVADSEKTLEWYKKWVDVLLDYKFPIALAVQDGMTKEDVHRLKIKPDWIFVGGSTKWKWRTVKYWTKHFLKVHVGRVNTENMLWACDRMKVASSDGTGWWHHKQYKQLINYLTRSNAGLMNPKDENGFFKNY